MSSTQSQTTLGKRAADKLVLRLASGSDTSSYVASESGYEDPTTTPSSSRLILVNGRLVPKTKKRYKCLHDGCEKSYSKPSRLAEHERSHTGQRPFECQICHKSYFRETHLQVHARSHLPESSKPLVCPKPDCTKRFWTSQHLRVHIEWHDGAKQFKCTEPDCNLSFNKHNQLRAHMCSLHAPLGTKPYQCDHPDCRKSFDTNQHLRTHKKTHDEQRYTCVHPSCLAASNAGPIAFQTWTALQQHIKNEHPPTCTDPSCNGRTFASQKGLRAHQKLHEQREIEQQFNSALTSDCDDPDSQPKKKRRRGGEIGRDWKCEIDGCEKDFKSKNALTKHVNVAHLGRRDHRCPYDDCGRTYGYKHLLQRHLASAHTRPLGEQSSTETEFSYETQPGLNDGRNEQPDRELGILSIDTITGLSYAQNAIEKLASSAALCCPYPHLESILIHPSSTMPSANTVPKCEYVFSRAYDFRRHLKAMHNVEPLDGNLEEWVKTKIG